MDAHKRTAQNGCRSLEVFFQPGSGPSTGVEVLLVDYIGPRRLTRRIGSVRLGLGRSDLVGLTPSEVTWLLVSAFYEWLSVERANLRAEADPRERLAKPPAPPAGVTGAAVDPLRTDPLPGL